MVLLFISFCCRWCSEKIKPWKFYADWGNATNKDSSTHEITKNTCRLIYNGLSVYRSICAPTWATDACHVWTVTQKGFYPHGVWYSNSSTLEDMLNFRWPADTGLNSCFFHLAEHLMSVYILFHIVFNENASIVADGSRIHYIIIICMKRNVLGWLLILMQEQKYVSLAKWLGLTHRGCY